MEYYKNTEEAKEAYNKYIKGHIQNVNDALELLFTLDIPYVKDNIDRLREICSKHDESKWGEEEYIPYLHHFYPTCEEEANMYEEYDAAVFHHVRNNKHHWNCSEWVNEDNDLVQFNDDEYKIYTIERICDWLAMGYQHKEETPYGWWDDNKEGMVMPDYAREMIEDILHKVPNDYKLSFQITRGNLDESVLLEIKLDQIKTKSKNTDPARIDKSKNVKTTYIGMSDFGILNFKTTSESRSGYHYQTIEFRDMNYFNNIIKEGRPVTPEDIKKAVTDQDVNVWCTDESFAFWAWAHQAYKNDFLYIDDRIPNLKQAIQAPTVNNVRLNGGACKHILSVIDYITKPFVLLAIADDMNAYLKAEGEDKMHKQDVATQNQYDMVAQWDWSDIEDYTGLSKEQIIADIAKTTKISPSANPAQVIEDFVREALPGEPLGLIREISDKIEQELSGEIRQENDVNEGE